MMRRLLRRVESLIRARTIKPAHAGNFFPPEYKTFPFQEGDLLASEGDGKYSISKVLKIDKVELRTGDPIYIQGQIFHAAEDDFLLIVSCSYGEPEFSSLDEARAAARSKNWSVKVGHAPNRPPGALEGQVLVGHEAVSDEDLEGYRVWKAAFDKGKAGVF
jgi:hypothetical protein